MRFLFFILLPAFGPTLPENYDASTFWDTVTNESAPYIEREGILMAFEKQFSAKALPHIRKVALEYQPLRDLAVRVLIARHPEEILPLLENEDIDIRRSAAKFVFMRTQNAASIVRKGDIEFEIKKEEAVVEPVLDYLKGNAVKEQDRAIRNGFVDALTRHYTTTQDPKTKRVLSRLGKDILPMTRPPNSTHCGILFGRVK